MQQSVLDVPAAIPGPRGRHGRRYPIQSLLAALVGQSSLWAKGHADRLTR